MGREKREDDMKTIRHTETLYYYDGPQIFIAKDNDNARYIVVCVDSGYIGDTFLVSKVSYERIVHFRTGLIDLRTLLVDSSKDGWFIGKHERGCDQEIILEQQRGPIKDNQYLPDSGFFLQGNLRAAT